MANKIIGISITPEIGLEVAQIDFATGRVLKYGSKPIEFDNNRKTLYDIDRFNESLRELLIDEMRLSSKDGSIILNLPSICFGITDYPASLDLSMINNAILTEFEKLPTFQTEYPLLSTVILPNSTVQSNKVAYTATHTNMVIEILQYIMNLGFDIHSIETSVNTLLKALIYKERVNCDPETNWTLLIVDGYCCRVISMQGKDYLDYFEEPIAIGEVLGDTENYSTVISAVEPILRNLPSQYLCIVSRTNIISAEALADKIQYNAPIIHQEANNYSQEAFLEFAPTADSSLKTSMSLDIIGTAITKDFTPYYPVQFNLYNESLGELYYSNQPPKFGNIILTNALVMNLIVFIVIIAILLFSLCGIAKKVFIGNQNKTIDELNTKIERIDTFLRLNPDISDNEFDEITEVLNGLNTNKNIYSYYSIVGTEIPKKLWLTHLDLSKDIVIEGQADNIESVYAFYRNIKDYDPNSDLKLQKLGLASSKINILPNIDEDNTDEGINAKSLLSTMNADFYEFKISNIPEPKAKRNIGKKQDVNNGNLENIPSEAITQ